jgi:hypothetical protein
MDKEDSMPPATILRGRVMRLFDMAQIAMAKIVDLRNVLPLLQFAQLTRADLLQDICMQVCLLTPLACQCTTSLSPVFV